MNRLLVSAALLILGAAPALAQGAATGRVVPVPSPTLTPDTYYPLSLTPDGSLRTMSVVVPSQASSGGLSVYRVNNPAGSTAMVVKNSAGRLYSFNLCNGQSSARYIRFYDAPAPVTGTTPVYAGAIVISAGTCQQFTTQFGLTFANGIGLSITGANGDADTTAVTAGDVTGFLGYQ